MFKFWSSLNTEIFKWWCRYLHYTGRSLYIPVSIVYECQWWFVKHETIFWQPVAMQIKGEQFVINQKCHRQDLFVDTSLSWLNMILNSFLCFNVNILLCSCVMSWSCDYRRCYIELIDMLIDAVPHPPFSLLLMVPVVLPVGGLPGGLDEHASQGAASATCRQHAVMP